MSPELVPSILSADFTRLGAQVGEAVQAGVRKIQVDVMDGHFVPNISVGLPVVRSLARSIDVTLDVHLMIERPERFIAQFADAGADVITVHVEAANHLHRVVEHIHSLGLQAGAALNPATPLGALEEILADLDVALVMTVDPGFGGQAFIPEMLPKIERLRSWIDGAQYRAALQVDGGLGMETAAAAVAAGAEQLVVGSAVFCAGVPVTEAVSQLRAAVES